MGKNEGWRWEPIRHSLASQGVETTVKGVADFRVMDEPKMPPKLLYVDWDDLTMGDTNSLIMLFWWCSIHNEWDWFDFDEAFGLSTNLIQRKLGNHFRLPEDEQKEHIERMIKEEKYGGRNFQYLDALFSRDPDLAMQFFIDLHKKSDAIVKKMIESRFIDKLERSEDINLVTNGLVEILENFPEFRQDFVDYVSSEEFGPNSAYDTIREVYDDMRLGVGLTLHEKIEMFDKIIDLYHHHGHIFSPYVGDIDKLRDKFERRYT